jgi:hypothetical protein
MAHTLYELDVRLADIEPPIWRTIEVPGKSSLEDVHFAIQAAMGWTSSHLHLFAIGGTSYGMVDVDGADELELEDERDVRLEDLAASGASFRYEYDFGDGWEHDVVVKQVTPATKAPPSRCTAGARACPPEDCGGAGGYQELLEALANPAHEEHADMVTWSGNFQPERFSVPKGGLDLRKEMARMRKLANEAEPDDRLGSDGAESVDLPAGMLKAVLALPPMQRAQLAALISGSLANELLDVAEMASELMAAMKKKAVPHGRTRAGSKRR